jgi:predicted nucleic-acid-binding Zn-ribbon protein
MMTTCPECGSSDIIPDLLVFADEACTGQHPPYVQLNEPRPAKAPFLWTPKSVNTGFRAAICGSCGYTRFYTKYHAELLEAHKIGYTSEQFALKNILQM